MGTLGTLLGLSDPKKVSVIHPSNERDKFYDFFANTWVSGVREIVICYITTNLSMWSYGEGGCGW